MKKDKAQVYLFGGLGNQLFQFYFGIYLNKVENKQVVFNESLSSSFGKSHGNLLSNVLSIETTPKKSKVVSKVQVFPIRVLIKIQTTFKSELFSKAAKFYFAPGTGFDAKRTPRELTKRNFGYFQTWRYFDAVGGKSHFYNALLKPRSESCLRTSELIKSQTSIGIHVRRGDYLPLAGEFGILALGYYEKALKHLGVNKETQIFLFSDDIDSAEKFLSGLAPNANWVYIRDTNPLESMLLLSQCQKICISNSTFGYWAAVLGEPVMVVAPNKWFRNLEDPIDLLPTNWALLSSEWQD